MSNMGYCPGSKQRQRLDAQAAASSLRASHHPGWGFRGQVQP